MQFGILCPARKNKANRLFMAQRHPTQIEQYQNCEAKRKPALAKKAGVGLSTLDALENRRLGELGYSKSTNLLSA